LLHAEIGLQVTDNRLDGGSGATLLAFGLPLVLSISAFWQRRNDNIHASDFRFSFAGTVVNEFFG
jgi:hypothetical protein